jgi:hypothetical protein
LLISVNVLPLSGCLIVYALSSLSSYILYMSMGKALWDKANMKYFYDLCKIEVLVDHTQLGHLNKVGWKSLKIGLQKKLRGN